MNDFQHEDLRRQIAARMSDLGRPSKLEDGYFRFQKGLGSDGAKKTTLAVYLKNVGSNLIELAFEPGATAQSVGSSRTDVVEWISTVAAATGREVNVNPRYQYMRIGIADQAQLEEIFGRWDLFNEKAAAAQNSNSAGDHYVSVPFYLESDGTKTLFLPQLRRTDGYRIGEKGDEQTVEDYWEALAALGRMSIPRFRRLNKNHNAGIVACDPDHHDGVKRKYIEVLIEQLTFQEDSQHD